MYAVAGYHLKRGGSNTGTRLFSLWPNRVLRKEEAHMCLFICIVSGTHSPLALLCPDAKT